MGDYRTPVGNANLIRNYNPDGFTDVFYGPDMLKKLFDFSSASFSKFAFYFENGPHAVNTSGNLLNSLWNRLYIKFLVVLLAICQRGLHQMVNERNIIIFLFFKTQSSGFIIPSVINYLQHTKPLILPTVLK